MSTRFSELTQDGLDANTQFTTDWLDVSENEHVSYSVTGVSGAHDNHIVALQFSLDKVKGRPVGSDITGEGATDNVRTTAKWVRLRNRVVEGAASIVNVIIQAK